MSCYLHFEANHAGRHGREHLMADRVFDRNERNAYAETEFDGSRWTLVNYPDEDKYCN